MERKSQCVNKLDVKIIKENLLLENKFIMNLCHRRPDQKTTDSKKNIVYNAAKKNKSGKVFANYRTPTLEELTSKWDDIKGKKMQYKGKLIKKGLKNKILKMKRRDERILKRKTLMKKNKDATNMEMDVVPKPKPIKPVFNSEGKIVFSKFDFAESPGNDTRNKKDTKDPHKLLKKIEKQKDKLKQLEDEGKGEKVAEIKENQAWKTAIQRASGVKVKDDPELLKQTLKKKIQIKTKSRKKWNDREKQVQKQIEERQQKRKANIDEHKRKKKAKKIQKLVKKGRIIPGI